jgi:Holliday junction DNA helicase RuvB
VEFEPVKNERYIVPTLHPSDTDDSLEAPVKLRPQTFAEYPGQDKAKENLKIYVQAARMRGQAMDHVLLHGPPGLGKTTLAKILANELSAPFCSTSGPAIERPGDLAGILAGLEKGALLFIDEIHRLSIHVEEVLYGAMEDFSLSVIVGQGPTARTVTMDIAAFTLVGATTKVARLSKPFLNRFGIQERLEYYEVAALVEILQRSARCLNLRLDISGAKEIAQRSRGTPRIANRLLRRAADFAQVCHASCIDKLIAHRALTSLEIDESGLDRLDRAILSVISERYRGGPVGIETLAITLGEESATIEDVYEPFLVYQGFLSRGPRGRSLTESGKELVARSKGIR